MCTYRANLKRFYLGKKKKKKGKKKSRKRQKVGHGRENGNFVQHTLPPFLPHFLPILERLNCGGPREKMARPHHFSLPLPLSSKHPSHPFSLLFSTLFFFPSSLRVRLVGGVEKWKDEKLWKDGKVGGWKIFSFSSCVFGWRGGKVGG